MVKKSAKILLKLNLFTSCTRILVCLLMKNELFHTNFSLDYLGCYIDQGERDLPELVWKDNTGSMNARVCTQHCFDGGFQYAGTQVIDFRGLWVVLYIR